MSKNKLKQKCTERVKIFQQAMESCHSSSPMDCIEWFADRIAELEKDKQYFSDSLDKQIEATLKLQQENAELKEKIKWYSEQVCNKECAEVWGELTKAKEIIKYLLDFIKQEGYRTRWDINIVQAEQFISEVGK